MSSSDLTECKDNKKKKKAVNCMQLLTFFTLRHADEDELFTHVGLPLSDPC